MTNQPTKSDLEAVFQRLRSIPANKSCFDCGAKNPTWASVTYGVFICIDCSASHRNLGVHLSFVRSTQLDTNWTWVQLRQMQVGGNANAQQFFQQHNCITEDTQKKYNSRAASLYRDKVNQLAVKAMQNNSQLHLQPAQEKQEEKEVDFFTEAENFTIPENASLQFPSKDIKEAKAPIQPEEGPKVDLSPSQQEHKPTIGIRKIQPKKSGLGAKKGGLGATKVKTNFADIEREAELAEESRLRMHEENQRAAELTVKEKEERDAAVRLAYKDLGEEQQKREQQLKKVDPKKAEQMERLGMGFHSRSGVSHSVSTDMQTIEQENDRAGGSVSALSKLKLGESSFLDEYYSSISMNRNSSTSLFENSKQNDFDGFSTTNKDNWVIVDDPLPVKPKPIPKLVERTPRRMESSTASSSSDSAQKKFGGAKAISSQQFFSDNDGDSEHKANLSRFQGSSSISSSEYFGNDQDDFGANKFQPPDLEDVRESFRQGVNKVAGRISSLANGMVSSLQERYGY